MKPDTTPVQNNDRPNQTNLDDQSDRLLSLESEIQTLRLTLNEKEQIISKLRSESDRYYSWFYCRKTVLISILNVQL